MIKDEYIRPNILSRNYIAHFGTKGIRELSKIDSI